METKDITRIQDIKNKPSYRHFGLASKMSKLITNGEKAKGRYEASLQIFGTTHKVTQIFLARLRELGGLTGTPITRKIEVVKDLSLTGISIVDHIEEVIVIPEAKAIHRTKEDFPLSKRVRFGEDKGTVVSHETEDEDSIYVLFDGQEKAKDINIYKLKFA